MFKFILQIFCLYLAFLVTCDCKEICYDKYGCFIDTYPFGGTLPRPLAFLPSKPSELNPRFRLYNKKSPQIGEYITPSNLGQLFDPTLKTKVIIHGFLNSENTTWVPDLKDAFLSLEDMNIIAVDWSSGSYTLYTQAVANTQLVARMTAEILNNLINNRGLKASDIHIIGHSLGAHTAGYISSNRYLNVTGIDRITGLDAASPYFEHTPAEVRLDITDANFVDVIHTDTAEFGTGFGLLPPIGHVDFYINNGKNQPGCLISPYLPASKCSHNSAYLYFIDSIRNKCKYHSFPCKSYNDFLEGKCLQCNGECNRMGYWASRNLDGKSLYLNSNSVFQTEKPVCKQQYRMILKSPTMSGEGLQAKGVFTIQFKSKSFTTDPEIFDNGNLVFVEGTTEQILFSADQEFAEDIESAFITFKRNFNFVWNEKDWHFDYVKLYSALTKKEVTLCPKSPFYPDRPIEYVNCYTLAEFGKK